MEKFFAISSLLPVAVLSIRDELDLEISQDDYLKIFNDNLEKGKNVFAEFLQAVEQKNA